MFSCLSFSELPPAACVVKVSTLIIAENVLLEKGKSRTFLQKDKKYRISLATCGEIYYTDIEIHPGLTTFFGNGGDEIGNG